MGKYAVGTRLTRADMAKVLSTKDILGWDDRDIMVCHHRMKN